MVVTSRTTLSIAAAVLVLPSLCFVGLALVGQAIEDAQPALARDPTPEEREAARRAREIEERAWRAMTPAQHLEGARAALARDFDPATGCGGQFPVAERHLGAIAGDAGLASEIAGLRAEIRARQGRELAFAIAALQAEPGAAPPGAEGHSLRCAMFGRVRQRARTHTGVFSPAPPYDLGLVVHHAGCDEATLRQVLTARESLRRMNFERVQCVGGGAMLPVQEER